jgi:hypothetical protein
MSNPKIDRINGRARDFFEKIARKPYKAFFALLLLFALLSGAIFFDLKKNADSPRAQDEIADKNLFDSAAADRYRQVFEIIDRRRADYLRADGSLYPDVFRVPDKSGVIFGADAENLTEAKN